MVAEPWLLKMALLLEPLKSHKIKQEIHSKTIGILAFEVANVMSKTVRLHKSLTSSEISKLKSEILTSNGVKALVSSDETYLLDLALSEKLDDLNFIAGVVSRLGKNCSIPQLQGFQHIYGDIVIGAIDVRELGFLVKDMNSMVRKMEQYVNSTATLYVEMEVLNELELATKKFQQNHHEESLKVFQQKLIWQKQDVRHLKNVSLWNQTYDKIMEMLARTVCTLYARICLVFSDTFSRRDIFSSSSVSLRTAKLHTSTSLSQKSNQIDVGSVKSGQSGSVKPQIRSRKGDSDRDTNLIKADDFHFACGRLFMECLSTHTSGSKLDDEEHVSDSCSVSSSVKRGIMNHRGRNGNLTNTRLAIQAPPNTLGGSALALHYANIVIVIEKLLHYPHLVGEEARDDLYQMLPTSLKISLKRSMKSYAKDLAIYDAPLAHEWKDRIDRILAWLAPLAHNMIHWQTERNFEHKQMGSKTNVLLLQTLYFADREKTEGAICEVLFGLNYICRYEHQQNALLDCGSSFDFDDWQLQ